MPNTHGQVTRDDFQASQGQYRIIREEMSDGELSIVADIHNHEFAKAFLFVASTMKPRDVFTLCDENGPLKN